MALYDNIHICTYVYVVYTHAYVNVHIHPVYTFSAELLLIEVTDDRDYEDVFLITSTVVPRTNTLVEVTLEKFTEYPVPDFFSDLVSSIYLSIDCY